MNKEISVYDNSISARTYLSYIAEQAGGIAIIGRDGKLYIKTFGESIVELPLNRFKDFKWGEKFKITRVYYEDGIQRFEQGDTTGNTVYISQDNMYIVDQEQIDNIYNEVKDLEIYSFEGTTVIDPAIDVGDILLIDGKKVIYQGSSEYAGHFIASISSKIQCKAKEETTTRTPSQTAINRRVQSQIDQATGKITLLSESVEENEEKIAQIELTDEQIEQTVASNKIASDNDKQELLQKFDNYAPTSEIVRVENKVTQLQTDTYTKTQIDTKLVDGSVTKLKSTTLLADDDGLTVDKSDSKTKSNLDADGLTILDKTGSTNDVLLRAQYDEDKGETVVETKNLYVQKYLTVAETGRLEKYTRSDGKVGVGGFYVGG